MKTTSKKRMKLEPLGSKVLVRRAADTDKTPGGIVLPDTAKEKPKRGTILAVGEGRYTEAGKLLPLRVKTGDEVLFASFAGTEVQIEGEPLIIMEEADLLGIVR